MLDAREFIEAGVKDGIPYEVRVTGYLEYIARRLYFAARASLHDALAIEAGDETTLAKYGIVIPPKSDFPTPKKVTAPAQRIVTVPAVENPEPIEEEGEEKEVAKTE